MVTGSPLRPRAERGVAYGEGFATVMPKNSAVTLRLLRRKFFGESKTLARIVPNFGQIFCVLILPQN